jgi:outer membrane protein OmpA-like peptidoglycan-associated protein
MLAMLPVAQRAYAQQPAQILAGPSVGFDAGARSGSIPVYAASSDCGVFKSGSLTAPSGGGELLLPSFFSERFGLLARAAWRRESGTMETTPVDQQSAVDPGSEALVVLDRRYRLALTTSTIVLDLLPRLRLGSGWAVAAGPVLGYRLDVQSTQTDNVLGPNGLRLAGGQQAQVMINGVSLSASPFVFGLAAAVSHELPVGQRTLLIPAITAHTELSSAVKEASMRAFSVGAEVSLLFDLTPIPAPPPPPPPPPPPVAVQPPPPHTPRLFASIRMTSTDDSGHVTRVSVVRATEVLYRRYIPLLPAIFFDHDSAGFAARYVHDAVPPEDSAATAMLQQMGVLDVHHNNLTVIGTRMRSHPAAHLTLHGSTSNDEAQTIARSRAELVRDYLASAWGLARDRISIADGGGTITRSGEATEDGRAENRRVEFTSDDPAILAPITVDRVVRDFNPPSITMEPVMEAEAGVKHWEMTVRQGGTSVAHYTSDDSKLRTSDLTWNLANDRIDSIPSPLGVELAVEDSTGATTIARDELPITLERRRRVVEKQGEEEADRIAYQLMAFDYNSPEPQHQHRKELEAIAATLDTGAQVRIVGFTDRIGGEEYNAALSQRRAERTAITLRGIVQARGTHDVAITNSGAGIETERFGNDTPEGRILSRGVKVVVEKPAHVEHP